MKKILFVLLLVAGCLPAVAQWSDNPEENNRVSPQNSNIYESYYKVLPDGTTYLVFNRPFQGSTVTFLQIIDKDGKMLFPEEGKIISQYPTRTYTVVNNLLITDSDNNAIIAVHDGRNSSGNYPDLSYSAYKVSPAGEMLWGDNGIDLNQGHCFQFSAFMQIIQLEDKSYVFAWESRDRDSEPMGIKMQRLSVSGEFKWENYVELKDDQIPYTYPYLTNAGNNQFNLVYAKGSNQDIMVRKIDFDGQNVWPQDTRVYRGGFPSVPLHTMLRTAVGPNGGVFVGWNDDREMTNKESTYVSLVKPDGSLAFSSGDQGEKVGYADLRGFAPDMIYDETENCLFVAWREISKQGGYQRISAQRVEMTGELKWGPEGIEVSPLDVIPTSYNCITGAGAGQTTVFFMQQHNAGYGNVLGYAVRLDKNGNRVWGEEPVVFTNYTSEKGGLKTSPLINNSHWLTMWSDSRQSASDDPEKSTSGVYMQKVNMDGTLGTPGASVENAKADGNAFNAIPNVIEENTVFAFNNANQGLVDISIYSLSGQKVAVACHQAMDKGLREISWNAKSENLAGGVYVATITTASGKESVRIILK